MRRSGSAPRCDRRTIGGLLSRTFATVSVDVDPVDLHLMGYGFTGLTPDHQVYADALPRIADRFAAFGVRATFFVVGRDARGQAPILKRLAAGGHEIASHSLTHPMPFVRVGRSRIIHEVTESKRLLEEACGEGVVGFRAPNWDISPRAVAPLADAGFQYDASAFPSPFLIPARLLLALKARDPRVVLRMRPWPYTLRRRPYVWRAEGRSLIQFPISVTPRVRFPIYHTVRYMLSESGFLKHLDGFARRKEPFFYVLHGVDALGQHEDRVDPRLARHPGMESRLDAKLTMLESALRAIADRFETVTYRHQAKHAESVA